MPAPIFKYVGGKRWLADKHANLLPDPDDVARRGGTYRYLMGLDRRTKRLLPASLPYPKLDWRPE